MFMLKCISRLIYLVLMVQEYSHGEWLDPLSQSRAQVPYLLVFEGVKYQDSGLARGTHKF
jgi:hypothetical protein